jgi:hypothetical protein
MGPSASDRSKALVWSSKKDAAEVNNSDNSALNAIEANNNNSTTNNSATWGRRDMRRVHVLHSSGSFTFFSGSVEEANDTGLAVPLFQNFWRSTCYSRKKNFAIQEWGVTVTSNNER